MSDIPRYACGLQNIGNTCYMNAIIQLLIHLPKLQKYFVEQQFANDLISNVVEKIKKDKNTNEPGKDQVEYELIRTVTSQFYKVIVAMENEKKIIPTDFKTIISLKNDTFKGNDQNDSHELINFILDSIHEETKSHSVMRYDRFPEVYKQVDNVRNSYNEKINNVQDIEKKWQYINAYYNFEKEHQHEISMYYGTKYFANYLENNLSIISRNFTGIYHSTILCDTCKTPSHSFEIFTTLALEIPLDKQNVNIYDCLDSFTNEEILNDENKYKCCRCNTETSSKKQIRIWNSPEILIIQLKRFKTHGNSLRKIGEQVDYPERLNMAKYICPYNKKDAMYELVSVNHHHGAFGGGHYTSCCKLDDQNWYHFDDSNISLISEFKNTIVNSSYLLIYSKL